MIAPGVIPTTVYEKLERDAPVPRKGESGMTYHLKGSIKLICTFEKDPEARVMNPGVNRGTDRR